MDYLYLRYGMYIPYYHIGKSAFAAKPLKNTSPTPNKKNNKHNKI